MRVDDLIGSDCSAWNDVRRMFCGALATHVRYTPAGDVVGIYCATHAPASAVPIPPEARRADRATLLRDKRFINP